MHMHGHCFSVDLRPRLAFKSREMKGTRPNLMGFILDYQSLELQTSVPSCE